MISTQLLTGFWRGARPHSVLEGFHHEVYQGHEDAAAIKHGVPALREKKSTVEQRSS